MKVSAGHKNPVVEALQAAYDYGVIYLYSGAQLASTDDAEAGTLLASTTESGGAFESQRLTLKLQISSSGGW